MNELPGQRVIMLLENSPFSRDGRARREANTLAAAGCRVVVICPQAPGEGWRMQHGPITAYQYPAPPAVNGLIGYAFEYGYALAATMLLSLWVAVGSGFDVVHAHNPLDLLVLIGGFYKCLGKRFVYDQRDLAPEMYLARFAGGGNRLLHRTLLFFERLSCRWADHVIVAIGSHRRVLIERAGIPASRVTIVRNGPEPCHFQTVEPEPSLADSGRTLIGYVGITGHQDGLDYLFRALHQLKHQWDRADWHCVVVGAGDALEDLKRLTRELRLGDHIDFTGWIDFRAVPRYVSAMDICVVPDPSNSYTDRSTIIKLMEYMAQAKPVVAFDLPEHRVTAGGAALYAIANDESDLVRQIVRMIDDGALRQQLGEIGRVRALNTLAWSHQEKHLLNAYQGILKRQAAAQEAASREYVR